MIINEGTKGEFLIHGVLVFVVALIFLFVILPLGVLLIIAAIALFSASTGIEIDEKKETLRKFRSFFGFKIGDWEAIQKDALYELILSTENSTIMGSGGYPGAIIPNGGKLKALTYDLTVLNSNGKRTLFEFVDYKIAKQSLKALNTIEGINTKDKIAEKLAENKLKRLKRR